MGRFWIEDDFVRKRIQKHKLTLKAIAVYMALCSHLDKDGQTFVGQRTLAKELGISKNTVTAAMAELEVSHLLGRSRGKKGQPSQITIPSVPNDVLKVSHALGPKEVFKEDIKEGEISSIKTDQIRKQIRDKFSWSQL